MKEKIKTPAKNNRSWLPIVLLSIGVVFLALAQSALWINQTIFNQANFTTITTTSLTQQSSREAIASRLVDQALAERPVVKRVAGDRAKSIVSGLLDSDLAYRAIQSASNASYNYLTSPNREDISIDLTSIKTVGGRLVELAGRSDGEQATDEQTVTIPDAIVLVESDKVPNLSGLVTIMLALAPVFWIGTVICFGLYLYLSKWNSKAFYFLGLVIAGASLLGLLMGPFVPPPVASLFPNPDGRIVVQNLIADLLWPFQRQMIATIALTAAGIAIYSQRAQIARIFSKIK